ncbi:hypothetical protein L6303_04340 [archaeon]|nr:hypothetical protein [Nanoarchaeota archaeon]MBU4451709.1 hypothetical protein [Nanoarchaeota archaeon]MCG2723947.1 hypothetical protein [archaeon]
MSDFVKVLAAGVTLIIFALLISGSSMFEEEGIASNNITLFSQNIVGQIGSVQETFRRISFGSFSVGQTLGEETTNNLSDAIIENGWFREHSESFQFSGSGAVGAYMTFTVADMNKYGSLQIYFNDRKVYDNITAKGDYRIQITLPEATNTIEIKATSSAEKFWAPTTYILKDIKLVVKRYGEQEYVVPFTVYDYEAVGWSTGRLLFGVDDATIAGDLAVNVNGQEVYRDRPISRSTIHQKDFTREKAQIHAGENTLRFRTEKDATYDLSNVELLMFFFTGSESVTKKIYFSMGDGQLALYKAQNSTGRITFDVDAVYLDRGITVMVNNKPIELSKVESEGGFKENYVNFDLKDLRSGRNTIEFKTRGSYSLSNIRVLSIVPVDENDP